MEFSLDHTKHVATFGKGKSGVIVQGYINRVDNCLYAIKSISWTNENYQYQMERLEKEYLCLRHIHSYDLSPSSNDENILSKLKFYKTYIIRCYGLVQNSGLTVPRDITPPPRYLCLEACLGGTLLQQLNNPLVGSNCLPIQQCRVYVTQLVNILIFLFSCNVVHRDLKLSNLMLNAFGHIKLVDFDSAKVFNATDLVHRTRTLIGTLHLLAPEIIAYAQLGLEGTSEYFDSEKGYNYSIDWWNLGHLIYELFLKESVPFKWQSSATSSFVHGRTVIHATSRYQRSLFEAVQKTRGGHLFSEIDDSHWNYRAVSRFPSYIYDIEQRRNENRVDGKIHDFTSVALNDFQYEENAIKHLLQADDLIERLLAINPGDRFVYSAIENNNDHSIHASEKKNRLICDQSFLAALNHPFLIEELRFPNDLICHGSFDNYLQKLVKEYIFPINKKIGFYELFPQFDEEKHHAKAALALAGTTIDKVDEDCLSDEQQLLFKDF